MSDLRDFTGKNRKFTGAAGIKVSSDGLSDGDRVNEKGRLRFNDSTDLLEYYNGSAWKTIDAPPVITSFAIDGGSNVTTGEVDNEGGGTVSIAVNGSLFDTTGATVTAVGGGETLSPTSLTRNNTNLLTAVFTESAFDVGNSPYTLKVTNGSGLSAELADALSADQTIPTFTNAVDTTFTLNDSGRDAGISAANLCGTTGGTAHSVTTGSLPSGLSMTSATGAITGTASAVGTNTTTTFTVTATGDDSTSTRQFKITVNAPVTSTFNSPGTFSVPASLTSVDVLVVAGGAGAGSQHCGGGGAGGLIYRPGYPISAGSPISVTVGPGSVGGGNTHNPGNGVDSTFSGLTAKGGGGAGHGWPAGPNVGKPGGSGGGASAPGTTPGGSATQPGQPGDSGTYGFGHAGGNNDSSNSGAGGGGAGAVGTPNSGSRNGGAGRAYSISGSSVTYAGGGGGASHADGPGGAGGSGGGGAGGTHPGSAGGTGTANRGSGGGGGSDSGRVGGAGGTGVVIVAY